MRIVHVLLSPRIGGAESFVSNLMLALTLRGHEQELIYLDPENGSNSRLRRILRLRKKIFKIDPDFIISHTALPNLYTRASVSNRYPVIAVLHSSGNDYAGKLMRLAEKFLAHRTAGMIAVSPIARERYFEANGSTKRIEVIPNGVSPLTSINDIHSVEDCVRISTISRISSVKNPELWSRVANNINNDNINTVFEWYGPQSVGEDHSAIIKSHATNKRARFSGSRDDVNEILLNSDILFHSSDREAMPLSLVEAAMVGLPIVCSRPVARALGSEFVSAVFTSGDAKSAESALREVMDNYERQATEALERVQGAKEKFSIDTCALHYEVFMGQIMARRREIRR